MHMQRRWLCWGNWTAQASLSYLHQERLSGGCVYCLLLFILCLKKPHIYIWSSNYLIKIQHQDENPPKEAAGLQQQLYKC